MRLFRTLRPLAAGALLVALGAAAPQRSAPPQFPALSHLERGEWQLRSSDGSVERTFCLRDPVQLLQFAHAGLSCSKLVAENNERVATVHYRCEGHGNGRTSITVETPRVFQLRSQGIRDGSPFALELEGRRSGACR